MRSFCKMPKNRSQFYKLMNRVNDEQVGQYLKTNKQKRVCILKAFAVNVLSLDMLCHTFTDWLQHCTHNVRSKKHMDLGDNQTRETKSRL